MVIVIVENGRKWDNILAQTQSEKSFESFDQLINKIRKSSKALRNKGTLFEYMTKVYLEQAYPEQFANVWMLKEVPSWTGISHQDLGVDLVCQDKTNPKKFIAVQDKFYKENHTVSKPDVDSFVAELGNNKYSSGIWIATNDKWNHNAERMLTNTSKPISRIGLSDLRHADIDWSKFDATHLDTNFKRNLKKSHKHLRPYQVDAVNNALTHYRKYYQQGKESYRRGTLVMAPGTGKTFTSLNIAERLQNDEHKNDFYVLYLVPSIQLLSQTLFSWDRDVNEDTDMVKFAVTSDRNATKTHRRGTSFISAIDIGYPATTNADKLVNNYHTYMSHNKVDDDKKRMFVVFSTYQSIDVIHQAQQKGFPNFNLTICDEAHRTAGHYGKNDKEGFFTKILHNNYVHSQLRLFQTATPKVYGTNANKKSKDHSIVLASMDNHKLYGTVFYRLTFGQAVETYHCLTDYKVEVLTVDERYIEKHMQDVISDNSDGRGIPIDMAGKIIGTWNAMLKRRSFSTKTWGQPPMKRAIAFAQVIDSNKGRRSSGKIGSKQLTRDFNYVMNHYLNDNSKVPKQPYHISVRHADGSMNAMQKKNDLDWLRAPVSDHQAKILSNVKFLGEGVDVPSLDAVIFYAPKQSKIDIVQAVGRVMRKFRGKKFGYIIIPIVIPYGTDPKDILDRNASYKNIWDVLNALRSIDNRFDAEVNKLSLHNYQPGHIHVHGYGDKYGHDDALPQTKQMSLNLVWKGIYNAITGEIVKHVGNRYYLDNWSKDVTKIANRHINWIKTKLQDRNSNFSKMFNKYWASLKYNINDRIKKAQAINMIAEHIITKPVFNALFSNNDFVNNNPVSKAMEGIIDEMIKDGFQRQQDKLKPFYHSVKLRASGINDANDKQQFIKTLYNNFFSRSFKNATSRLGIVFTPVPIVNFIVHSVNYALIHYFPKECPQGIASKGVNVLDPFVGTGTFITQTLYYLADLLQKGIITKSDIVRNYTQELHCNEIVLLSYYIAAINIESVFNEIMHSKHYQEFKGIVLTDTFESTEDANNNTLNNQIFVGNNQRLKKEKQKRINVIMSNPPYSRGQNDMNDNQANLHYPKLERDIKKTYVKETKITHNMSLSTSVYNSYIKALRWATNRIGHRGVIGFVTSSGFVTAASNNGVRKCLYHDFNYLYIYNLRGYKRLFSKGIQEGDSIFGSKSMSAITLSVLVKDGSDNHKIFYKDINEYKKDPNEYLHRNDKFNIIKKNNSIKNIKWHEIKPDNNNDWIDKNDPGYQKYMPLAGGKNSIFPYNAMGTKSNRNKWVYGFSKEHVANNVQRLITNYNKVLYKLRNVPGSKRRKRVKRNSKKIKWSPNLFRDLKNGKRLVFHKNRLILSLRRPFTKKWLYYDKNLVDRPNKYYNHFGKHNKVIYTSGRGSMTDFSVIATDTIPDIQVNSNGQGFMRYNNQKQQPGELLPPQRDSINVRFAHKLGLSTDDTFYYIYGILNSPEYQNNYKNDLRKNIARIPIVKNVQPFVDIGKKLMWLHIHYEDIKPRTDYLRIVDNTKNHNPSFYVIKMKHPSPQRKHKDVIKFNKDITIKNIPLKAYKYVINGKSAVDWIIDQYKIKKDKSSGIIDNPNDFSKDPKYLLKLLLKVINMSIQTVNLVDKLPQMQIIDFDWRKY